MPWKAFMQSSALTNSDNQLANELFMQSENASCSLNIAPKWGDSLFELFCCYLGETKPLFAQVLNGCTYMIHIIVYTKEAVISHEHVTNDLIMSLPSYFKIALSLF